MESSNCIDLMAIIVVLTIRLQWCTHSARLWLDTVRFCLILSSPVPVLSGIGCGLRGLGNHGASRRLYCLVLSLAAARVLWPRLTSGLKPGQRSPGKGCCFCRIYPPHLRLQAPGQSSGLILYCRLTRLHRLRMWFLFVGSRRCLRLPSDPQSIGAPLPSANTSRHQGVFGTFTL